jgi:hypothetical protein
MTDRSGGFELWLRLLETEPELLQFEIVRTRRPHELGMYQRALALWRESDYPHPGEWPDAAYQSDGSLADLSHTRNWMLKRAPGQA